MATSIMHILLIDDDDDVRTSIGDYLDARGHHVVRAKDGARGVQILRDSPFDVVITDIKMPGLDGFEVLRNVRQQAPETEVIMMTGYGDIDAAVTAMREGAFDFFTKPVKMRDLRASLERTARFHALRQEKNRVQNRLNQIDAAARQRYGMAAIMGESPAMQAVKTLIRQVSQAQNTTVLVHGETGTGKELVARAIHHESDRSLGPFIPVDCTSVPESLAEAQFYGHEKGAFTDAKETRKGHFEQADGGTLFLDEIGDMAPDMQARLLRTLEERQIRRVGGTVEIPVDVRVISATNRNLGLAVTESQFREDLYHRLNTFIIQLPPLRERPEDMLSLVRHFLSRYAHPSQDPIEAFTPDALGLLRAYAFPGNVRELKNTVERAVILAQNERITVDHLKFTPSVSSQPDSAEAAPPMFTPPTSLDTLLSALPDESLNLSALEENAIREAIRRSGGNRGQAADRLGLSRFALRRRMALYKIEEAEDPPETGSET